MIRLTVATRVGAVLAFGMVAGGCSSPEGGIAAAPSNAAQVEQAEWYDYYEREQGKSPRWVDQWMCVSDGAMEVSLTLDELLSSDLGIEIPEDAKSYEQRLMQAEQLGDEHRIEALRTGHEQAVLLLEDMGRTAREAAAAAIAPCDVSDLSEAEIDRAVDYAVIGVVERTSTISEAWGGPTWEGVDGQRSVLSTAVSSPPPDLSTGSTKESGEATQASEGGLSENGEVYCDEIIAATLGQYVTGHLTQESSLQRFVPSARQTISDLLEYAMSEVNAGRLHPNDVAIVMGSIDYGPICLFND